MSERTVDETDKKIIRMLQVDARTSFADIGRECGISAETVKNRFEGMVEDGVIRGTSVVVDPRKLDKKHIVFIGIRIAQPYSSQVLNMVRKTPGVCVATRAMGRYDIEAIAVQENVGQIGTTKDTIGDFQQVKDVDVDIFVDKPLLCPKNFEFE